VKTGGACAYTGAVTDAPPLSATARPLPSPPAGPPQTRAELLARLRELKPWLESQGVVDLRLFGSFARDEARPDSDVDLLCRLTRRMGLEFFGIQIELAQRLGREVELFSDGDLRPFAQRSAERDSILV
jgi:predicted nucleotidyltransferase